MDRNDESCRSGASVRPIKILRRGSTQNRGSKSWNRENRSSRPVLTESARGSPRLPRGYASGKNSVRDQTTSRTLTIFAWPFSCTTRCTFVCARCSIGDVKGEVEKKNKKRETKGRIRTTKMHHPEHRPRSIHPRRPGDRVSKVCMMSVQRWCNFIDADGKGSDGSLKIVRNYPGARS